MRVSPELILKINAFRAINLVEGQPNIVTATYWKPFFSQLNKNRPIVISGKRANKGPLTLTIAHKRQDTIELPRRQFNQASHEGQGVSDSLHNDQGMRAGGEITEPWELRLSFERAGRKRDEGRLRVTQQGFELKPPKLRVPFPAHFVSSRSGNQKEDAVRLGLLRARKQGDLLTKALRVVEPRLQSVEDLSASGVPMIWGDIGLPELVPLAAMGEGMLRVARIVLAMSSAPGGVVLVDEIENGIHHSILNKVWEVVAEAAELFDTQLFATTHSFECFKAAHSALSSNKWRFHRLDRTGDGASRCVTYDTEDVDAAIRHGLEVR